MAYIKRIVCLANSRKLGGRCIAGKEVWQSGYGEWIRPIGYTETGELALSQIQCQDRQIPRLLDVIQVPLEIHRPHTFQAENHLITANKIWMREQPILQSQLPLMVDDAVSLWFYGFNSFSGINDRIPEAIADAQIRSSLLLIKPEQVELRVVSELGGRKVRAHFVYHDVEYLLMVTDPIVENEMLRRPNGNYPIPQNSVYLCVSLGEPFQGFTYKLVAAVIYI